MNNYLITTPETDRLVKGLINKFGFQHQIGKCIEELRELVGELEEVTDYNHDCVRIAEEVADVLFTLNHVIYILGIHKQVAGHLEVIKKNCEVLLNQSPRI